MTIEWLYLVRNAVDADQPADAEFYVRMQRDIVDSADRYLVDRKDPSFEAGHIVKQLILVDALGTQKERVGLLEDERALEHEAVERIAGLQHLAAPGDRRTPKMILPERLGVGRRRGHAVFVHIRFELFRGMQAARRHLHRELLDRIVGQACGKAVELWGFDVKPMLVRLATAKRRGFHFPFVQNQSPGHHAE